VLNNNGYLLIRLTQNNFMEGRKIGIDAESGVSCPDLEKISHAYGIKFIRISKISEMEEKIKEMHAYKGAVICEVMTPENQLLIPRVASKKLDDGRMVSMPYDDMFPFLPREEYESNIVREKSEQKS
jgi:acetolactate synthase-1/2/3 large subunit